MVKNFRRFSGQNYEFSEFAKNELIKKLPFNMKKSLEMRFRTPHELERRRFIWAQV